jgi:hypothetical protein
MPRQGIHTHSGAGVSSRQSATYHRTKLLKVVSSSLIVMRHIDDLMLGFVTNQAKAAVLQWKVAVDDAQPYITDKGEE